MASKMGYKTWIDNGWIKIGTKNAKDGEWHSYNKDGSEMCCVKFGVVRYDSPYGDRSWSILFLKWMISVILFRKLK